MHVLPRLLVAAALALVVGGLFLHHSSPPPQENTGIPTGSPPGGVLTNGSNIFENSTTRTPNATTRPGP